MQTSNEASVLFCKNEGTPRPQHQCHDHRVWPRKPLLMFPWVLVMQQGCIIVTREAAFVSFIGSPLKWGACLWIKMYPVCRETFPYGLCQTVLQTLPKPWRQDGCAGNAQSLGSWWYASLNSLQPPRRLMVFLSLKYRTYVQKCRQWRKWRNFVS